MPKKRIFVDNPDPSEPDIDPETNTIDVGGGMFGSREYIPPPPYGGDKGDGNRRYQHPSLQASRGGTFNPSMSQFSSEWFPQGQQQKAPYVPGQTPTAEQEALQDPTIDPIFLAAGGLVGGGENVASDIAGRSARVDFLRSIPWSGDEGLDKMLGNSLRRALNPSIIDHIGSFMRGAGTNIGGGATTQAVFNQHPDVAKVGGLPAPSGLTDKAGNWLNYGLEKAGRIDEAPGVVDKFGRDVFDKSGKMIPWSESEKLPLPSNSPKIQWTKISDALKKLMGDIGEVE